MSGTVEIVSLALAVFPLVISLLEHYEDGYNTLGDWVLFRREFTHLVNNLNREQIIFRQHIEGMLRSVTDSEFELKEMMDDTNSPNWVSEEVASKLKVKLSGDGEYENYHASIKAIHAHLMNMQIRLNRCGPPVSLLDQGEPSEPTDLNKDSCIQRFCPERASVPKATSQTSICFTQEQMERASRKLGQANRPSRQVI